MCPFGSCLPHNSVAPALPAARSGADQHRTTIALTAHQHRPDPARHRICQRHRYDRDRLALQHLRQPRPLWRPSPRGPADHGGRPDHQQPANVPLDAGPGRCGRVADPMIRSSVEDLSHLWFSRDDGSLDWIREQWAHVHLASSGPLDAGNVTEGAVICGRLRFCKGFLERL